MDISLYSCNKSEINGLQSLRKNAEQSVRQKTRVHRLSVAPRRQSTAQSSSNQSEETVPKQELPRVVSTFRWRSAPDVVEGCLRGMHFTISGTLNCLTPEDLIEMIETCGGTIYKTLAKKSDYLLIGSNASKILINNAIDSKKAVLNEHEFIDLVKTKSKEQQFFGSRESDEGGDWSDIPITPPEDTSD